MSNFITNSWQDDTEWAVSSKGNHWRVLNGIHLVVGKSKGYASYWARVGEDFLDDCFRSLDEARSAAESEVA